VLVDEKGNEYFVFDDHTHLGSRPNANLGHASFDADQMVADMDACGVDMIVGFPMANPHTDYREHNQQVMSFNQRYPDRIVPFARIQPFFKEKAAADIHEYAGLGFKGLKLHPFMDFGGLAINNRDMIFPLMEAASAHKLTVLIHSGEAWNSSPALIGDLAQNFPDVTFIIGHSGLWEYHEQAIDVARRVANVYLDTAETAPPGVVSSLVRNNGAERVLYGSDHPFIPFGFEIGKVAKYAGLAPEQLRLVLGENLARVLGVTPRREGRKKAELTRI
jgi:predicted TIM-barrel fold metal-dependent hydrolase